MKPLDPTKNPEKFIEAVVAGDCRTLTDGRFKIPLESKGLVEISVMAEMQHNALGVVHFHWQQEDKSYKRCFVPATPIKIVREKDIEKVAQLRDKNLKAIQKEELDRGKEKAAPPAQKAPVSQTPEAPKQTQPKPEIVIMSVANIDKLVGKFVITAVKKSAKNKFEFNVVCKLPDGTPCEDSNVHTPMEFDSEQAAMDFIAMVGIVSDEETSFAVFKVAKVI